MIKVSPRFIFNKSSKGTGLAKTAAIERMRSAGRQVLPSLLRCDFGDLASEVARLSDAGTRILHLDVMDGHFVPNLTYGMPIVEGLRRHTDMPLDVHLMIADPLKYAEPMVDAGADLLTFHAEIDADTTEVYRQLSKLDVGVGVAINPDTPVSAIEPILDDVDLVLIMSVQAGFGGQSFQSSAVDKIREVRRRRGDVLIEVDGGIDPQTIGHCAAAGCDLFVVGSAIFGHDDYAAAIRDLDSAMNAGASAGQS